MEVKQFIQANKIVNAQKEGNLNHPDRSLDDITNTMQQVFGVSNLPVSHGNVSDRAKQDRLFEEVCNFSKLERKDKEYEQRISHLEN